MAKPKPLPDLKVLRALLRLDPETGKLYWKRRSAKWFRDTKRFPATKWRDTWNARFAGQEAFTAVETRRQDKGYRVGILLSTRYKAHRIIYKMVTGEDPRSIDHINGDTLDNRPSNLRSVRASVNSKNQKLRSTCRSGVMGVVWSEAKKRWVSRIRADYKVYYLGSFREFQDAVAARRNAEREFGFHKNHGTAR